MHQPLTKDFFKRMKKMVLYKVSNSLTVPLQVKNSKIEEKENGVKDPELLDKSIEWQSDDIMTLATIDDYESNLLKSMKLMLIIQQRNSRYLRISWQRWHKFLLTRDDLLTVEQSSMMKALQRVLKRHETIACCRKFQIWKHYIAHLKSQPELTEWAVGDDKIYEVIENSEKQVQTDNEVIEEDKKQEIPSLESKEVQTEQVSLEKNYATPIDVSKKKNSKSSDEKEVKSNIKESSQDFPLQISRGRQIAKPLRFTSEQNLELCNFTAKVWKWSFSC